MRTALCWVILLPAILGSPSTPGRSPTLVLLNGRVWTENPRQPEAEAIAIDGDIILSVDTSATLRKLAGADCKIIDLGGRGGVPGFNDAHVHLLDGGSSLISVQLGDADSPEADQKRKLGPPAVASRTAAHSSGDRRGHP